MSNRKAKQTRREMFKKLPQEMLADANELLQEEVQTLRKELWMRAAPRIAEMLTALGHVTSAAENGDKNAKVLLHEFFTAWRRAEEAGTMIDLQAVKPDHFQPPPGVTTGEAVISEHPAGEDRV